MTFPSGATIYTFAGVTFIRRIDGDEFPPWFNADPTYTKDAVLGGSLAYLDQGGDVYPPLAFRASCLSAVNRAALVAAKKTTGTLSNTRSQSATATLVKAVPLDGGDYSSFWIDLVFEYRP